jgi:hypothetical protein
MSAVVAFDSKEFKRPNKTGGLAWYTPLGCGIKVSKQDEFVSCYNEKLQELLKSFGTEPICACFPTSEYIEKIGHSKAYRMSDELLQSVQHLIDSVSFSFVVLPPKQVPLVQVGGYKSSKKELDTFSFLRKLSVYFSYITAWNYLGIESRKNSRIIVDGFSGKRTTAWDELEKITKPIVYPHGDECNPFISTADMIASLTDKKLYDNFKKLNPENLVDVWSGYSFTVEQPHFLGESVLSRIKWYTDDHIDLTEYYARPMVFMKADGFNTDEIKKLQAYPKATVLANNLKGGLQGFDKDIDSPKIRDGDYFLYAGTESTKLADTIKDLGKVTVMPFKDIEEKTE